MLWSIYDIWTISFLGDDIIKRVIFHLFNRSFRIRRTSVTEFGSLYDLRNYIRSILDAQQWGIIACQKTQLRKDGDHWIDGDIWVI